MRLDEGDAGEPRARGRAPLRGVPPALPVRGGGARGRGGAKEWIE